MALEGKKIFVSADCKTITVDFTTDSPTTVLIQDSSGAVVVLNDNPVEFTHSLGKLSFIYTHTVAFVGVLQIIPQDAVGDALTPAYSVATCKISCCIAALLKEAIECTCACDQCKKDLLRAEKVQLFLQAAVYEAEHNANLTQAVNNYNKASELCIEVCACGC
jgi:hypothetical protein